MKTLETLQHSQLELNTEKTDLKLTIRNQLKRDLVGDIVNYLQEKFEDNENIEIGLTSDGVGVAVYNEEMDTTITFVVDTTFKKLNYDLGFEIDSYAQELEDKANKKAEREKKKQAKIKADTLSKQQKQLERQLREKIVKGQVKMSDVKKALND